MPDRNTAAAPSSGKLFHRIALAAPVVPVLWLVVQALRRHLGANPIEKITHWTGDWCLILLLVTLAVSPLRKYLKRPELIQCRKPFGLWAFAWGVLHLFTFLWLDKFFDWNEIVKDVIKRPFITAGAAAFTLMIPLAVTSTRGMIRRLGKNWTRLHRLVYLSAFLGTVHYWWLVKADVTYPAMYMAALIALLAARVPGWWR